MRFWSRPFFILNYSTCISLFCLLKLKAVFEIAGSNKACSTGSAAGVSVQALCCWALSGMSSAHAPWGQKAENWSWGLCYGLHVPWRVGLCTWGGVGPSALWCRSGAGRGCGSTRCHCLWLKWEETLVGGAEWAFLWSSSKAVLVLSDSQQRDIHVFNFGREKPWPEAVCYWQVSFSCEFLDSVHSDPARLAQKENEAPEGNRTAPCHVLGEAEQSCRSSWLLPVSNAN